MPKSLLWPQGLQGEPPSMPPGQQCSNPGTLPCSRELQEPSQSPQCQWPWGTSGVLQAPAPSHYQFPARLISHPISCEYSPGVVQMCSTQLSSPSMMTVRQGITTDRFRRDPGKERPSPLKPASLCSLAVLTLCTRILAQRGTTLPWPPPLRWMGCHPGEMKYEAFVQRDQVSGQTKEHGLSGVHPGKDRQSSPVNG